MTAPLCLTNVSVFYLEANVWSFHKLTLSNIMFSLSLFDIECMYGNSVRLAKNYCQLFLYKDVNCFLLYK